MQGYIHSFESLAAVDGEGLRYGVFLAGCPLRWAYCHNPDTWQRGGREMSAPDLVKKISAYKPYFKENGGVTFSGGEPLVQAEFIKEAVPYLKEKGINYVTGPIATGDQFMHDADHKALVRDRFRAIACEMEGGSIGHVCTVNNVPFAVLRSISDGDGGALDYQTFAEQAALRSIEVVLEFIARVQEV